MDKIFTTIFFLGAIVCSSCGDVPTYKTDCAILNGTITLLVNYTKLDTRNETMRYTYSKHANVTGDCPKGDDAVKKATLKLSEDETEFVFHIMQNNGSENTEVDAAHWGVTMMTFSYTVKEPDAKITGRRTAMANGSFFNTPVTRTYSCSSDTIQLSNVSVKAGGNTSNISSVEYVFFMEKEMLLLYSNNTRPDKIPDNKYDHYYCKADQKLADLVPIIVGCALAALVVIVLVAYLIGRRRAVAPGGYERV